MSNTNEKILTKSLDVIDFAEIKKDFPIFNRKVNGNNLVYLDSAATSQKPNLVIDGINDYYENHNANVHRGIHTLSEEATELYEGARSKVANFVNATSSSEVIFTAGTTDGINFLADSLGKLVLEKDSIILTTVAEHHSNMLPWQQIAAKYGAKVEYINVDLDGYINPLEISQKLTAKVRIVALFHASNVSGQILPIKEISKDAHKVGAVVVVDGAQAIPHLPVNVQNLGCDFYVFSGHKMLSPTGIGVIWGKKELLHRLAPYRTGGGMIDAVYLDHATWAEIPEKFEAGTPNIEGAVGLAKAIDYLQTIGMENIHNHEVSLLKYAFSKLKTIEGLHIIGKSQVENRTGLISFYIDKIHPHDIASVLSGDGIAVRSGQHCTMPLHNALKIPASTRASFYLYNDFSDIDALVASLEKAKKILL